MNFSILDIPVFIFVFGSSFLWHDWLHIKSQGPLATGKIYVHNVGMTCVADFMHNPKLFYLGGGVLASTILFIMAFIFNYPFSFICMGWLHLCYGLCEGFIGYTAAIARYTIYVAVIGINIAAWVLL